MIHVLPRAVCLRYWLPPNPWTHIITAGQQVQWKEDRVYVANPDSREELGHFSLKTTITHTANGLVPSTGPLAFHAAHTVSRLLDVRAAVLAACIPAGWEDRGRDLFHPHSDFAARQFQQLKNDCGRRRILLHSKGSLP